MESIQDKLSHQPFLQGMKPEQLAIIARHAREVEFTKDQVIFRQNEHAHQFHLIVHGKVVVESYMGRAENLPLQIITAGDVLGWSWLFPPFTWHFQARALEPVKSIFIDGASLLLACEQVHSFGFELMKRMAQVVIVRFESAQRQFFQSEVSIKIMGLADPLHGDEMEAPSNEQSLLEKLETHPFFKGMKPAHLKVLANASMISNFEKGDVIFSEGDPANRFYVIQHGKVVLAAQSTGKPEVKFQIIGAGDLLGWSWLFAPYYAHFKASALESTQSLFLYGTRLREACEEDHELGYELMKRTLKVVIQRLQATRQRILDNSNVEANRC
ncbi:MAG: cyclic nucleotide-binding protein hydrogenase accessory protein HoxI [Verrucomicrobiales bacterium]|nr:cyclic nucleotide-binding protein hydrogenase accessory protein HoxI [Verrucomicrobiales bacterium]